MTSTVLVVAAHPDDEVLGCGGTIVQHVNNGDSVEVIFMADGVTSRGDDICSMEQQKRNLAAYRACEILGTQIPGFLRLPDNRMDTMALLDVVQALEAVIQKNQPSIIYTHHYGDINIDHKITHQAVMTACRPQGSYSVKTILCFEIPSSTEWNTPHSGNEFQPNWFVDITSGIDKKLAALEIYDEELRDWPHPRSLKNVRNLCMVRGASVNIELAEAYELVRNVI